MSPFASAMPNHEPFYNRAAIVMDACFPTAAVAPWTPITSQFTSIVDSSVPDPSPASNVPDGAVGAFGLGSSPTSSDTGA